MSKFNKTFNTIRQKTREQFKILLVVVPLFLYFVSCHNGVTLIKGPYLIYGGNNAQMHILWQVDTTSVDSVRWGNDTTYAIGTSTSDEYGSEHQHEYVLKGLAPGASYFYQVKVGGESYTGTFRAAPDTNATALKFIAYGDTRTNPGDHDRIAYLIDSVSRVDESYRTFLLSVGDFVTDGDKEKYWTDEFFNRRYTNVQEMIGSFPFQSCMGNHEKPGTLFKKYFPYPYVADRYWSFDYGPAHFVAVDQYVDYDSSSAQYQWLENDLKAVMKPWKIILLHEPGWSAGGGHKNNNKVQHIIEPLCEKYGIHLVIAGHNHYYSRAKVTTANGDSVIHITTGGGGAPLYKPDLTSDKIVTAISANHFCKVNIINSSELQVEVVSSEGKVIDTFGIKQ